jgi:hypothetical protein
MVDKFVVVRWLLQNVSVLREISAIVAKWAEATLSEKLEIVYLVAKSLLPVIETFPLFQAQAQAITEEEAQEDLAKIQSLGIALPILLNVVAPIVTSLIRVLVSRDD